MNKQECIESGGINILMKYYNFPPLNSEYIVNGNSNGTDGLCALLKMSQSWENTLEPK